MTYALLVEQISDEAPVTTPFGARSAVAQAINGAGGRPVVDRAAAEQLVERALHGESRAAGEDLALWRAVISHA